MILHSENDKLCPYFMGKDLFDAILHNDKRMVTFQDAEHILAFFTEHERYKKEVLDFISFYTKQ
jgi:fermentation-respiration switch protein FrsA (DUF1100 family)